MPHENKIFRRNGAALALGAAFAFAFLSYIRIDVSNGSETFAHAFAFSYVKWVGAATVAAGWWVIVAASRIRANMSFRIGLADALVVALLAWVSLSLIWSPDQQAGFFSLALWATFYVVFLLGRTIGDEDANYLLGGLGLVGMSGTLLLAIATDDRIVANGLGNQNFAAEFMVCLIPLGFIFWRAESPLMRWSSRVLTITTGLWLLLASPANLQYLSLGIWALAILALQGRRWLHLSIGLIVVGASAIIILTASFDLSTLPRNIRDRAQTWGNTVLMIQEAPVLGRGLGGYFHDIGGYTNQYYRAFPELGVPAYNNLDRQTDSAENEILHLTAEFGVAGLMLGALLAVTILHRLWICRFDRMRGLAGLVLLSLFASALVSFPFQNPATALTGALALGILFGAHHRPESAAPSSLRLLTKMRVASVLATALAVLVIARTVPAVRNDLAIGQSDAFNTVASLNLEESAQQWEVAIETYAAADHALAAVRATPTLPRSRLRAFTQVAIAGPGYWRDRLLGPAELEVLYNQAASAAPDNPLLIDLRIKMLLSTADREIDLDELESMLASIKQTTGLFDANAFVLEAALALQLGQLDRARVALDAAEQFLGAPTTPNQRNNLQNLKSLRAQLDQRVR